MTTFLEFTTTVLSLIAYWLVEALTSYNKQGFELLYSKIKDFNKEKVLIGLESTAHYGNNLIFYFHEKQFKLGIINPIQTATLRKTRIRKVKNDKVNYYTSNICNFIYNRQYKNEQ